MKYFNFRFLILFGACFVFIKCSKSNEENATQMRVTIFNETGDRIAGAKVTFTQSPYYTIDSSNTLISDVHGSVLFPNLSTTSTFYYIYAEEGCRNNLTDTTFPRLYTKYTLNSDSVIVYPKGVLEIANTTSELYNVVISGIYNNIPSYTVLHHQLAVGSHTVHTEQPNTPGTVKDTLINITCGDTSHITIP